MSRKQFIESQGATCRNWQWSWSFINEKDKLIIFGAWDVHTHGNTTLIFSEEWQTLADKKQSGYKQSKEHIHLIEEKGFQLKTFQMKYSDVKKSKDDDGSAKIKSFDPL
ncbi:MAG: HNH endonuclease, partial [Chloroflexi bacterium]|nr:HNH endonuclease [Chloroflexota bacterium]